MDLICNGSSSRMRHKTQMVTAAPASPSTDSDHTACPIDSDHSSTDIDHTVPATPSSVTQAFTETSEPEDVSEVEVDIEDESSLKAVVTFRGEKAWHNCEELKHRPVCADERDALANALTSKLPRSVYLDKLNKLDDTVLASGNRDQATTMSELDEVVTSAVVVFSSSHSDRHVSAQSHLDDSTIVEDCVNDIGPTPFKQHFEDLITQTVIEKSGDDNIYFCPTFIPSLLKYFLPLAGLWSGLLLGDLGRHGTGTIYQKLSQKYKNAAKKPTQNYTEDKKTQGIMEKSQWDLKKIRFQRRRLTRLDDFVHTYKVTLSALLREYGDSLKRGKKDPKDKARQGQSSSTSDMTEHAEDDAQGGKVDASSELTALWEKKDTEVVVSIVPTQIRGNSFTIRHSDMRTLRPHQWLTGETVYTGNVCTSMLKKAQCILADPARNSAEQAESDNAANKFRY
ncbi:hypothetical protein KUCAC02_012823 [Chaenocephalus aceratus]|uniref:Uncharacterized protein n=1 Tax=Chaenocephalus aceratus TaxID=36190 RepID=A0ACB9XBQ4_CHAAC|nr:hypothetical protein KUCAC02_012823 [Chaenocephalus aceratus]